MVLIRLESRVEVLFIYISIYRFNWRLHTKFAHIQTDRQTQAADLIVCEFFYAWKCSRNFYTHSNSYDEKCKCHDKYTRRRMYYYLLFIIRFLHAQQTAAAAATTQIYLMTSIKVRTHTLFHSNAYTMSSFLFVSEKLNMCATIWSRFFRSPFKCFFFFIPSDNKSNVYYSNTIDCE